eukprot:1194309-Pleurochrysis_carterae.AAC.3
MPVYVSTLTGFLTQPCPCGRGPGLRLPLLCCSSFPPALASNWCVLSHASAGLTRMPWPLTYSYTCVRTITRGFGRTAGCSACACGRAFRIASTWRPASLATTSPCARACGVRPCVPRHVRLGVGHAHPSCARARACGAFRHACALLSSGPLRCWGAARAPRARPHRHAGAARAPRSTAVPAFLTLFQPLSR